jgi:hypothetical protein
VRDLGGDLSAQQAELVQRTATMGALAEHSRRERPRGHRAA